MKKNETCILDCYEIEINRFYDQRGFFQELFHTEKYGLSSGNQISCSLSMKDVIRGLHCSPYYKLCTCLSGKIYDVVVDLRKDSPTYLAWTGTWLTNENQKQMFVPPGCGHGFYAAEDNSILLYLQGDTYDQNKEKEVRWNDPKINIQWPLSENYIISDKDKNALYIS